MTATKKTHWPRASIVWSDEDQTWCVTLRFGGNWRQKDVSLCSDSSWLEAYKDAVWLVGMERNKASFNPSYRYIPVHPSVLRAARVYREARMLHGTGIRKVI